MLGTSGATVVCPSEMLALNVDAGHAAGRYEMGTVHTVASAIRFWHRQSSWPIQLEVRRLVSRLGLVLVGPAVGIALWLFWWGR